jgi:ABC-type glycerol-3-phosphate transport system substrate-binding protein
MTEVKHTLTRRKFLTIAGTIGVGALAASCVPAAPPNSQSGQSSTTEQSAATDVVTVTFWDLSTTDAEIVTLDDAYLGFNNVQDTAQVEVSHGKDEAAVLAAVAAGAPPDVYWRWSVDTFGSWINKGVVQDLSAYAEASTLDWDRFVPVALEAMKWRDRYYGMPLTSAGIGLTYWHKATLEEAGLDPTQIPASLEEVMEYSDALTVRDDSGQITRLGFHPRLDGITYFPALFNANYWDATAEQLTPTDPGLVASMQWMADWYAHYGIDEIDRFLAGVPDYYSSAHPLCTDAVAMFGGYEWDSLFIGLGCDFEEAGFAAAPHPAAQLDNPTCSQGAIALVIPNGAAQPDAAWSLIEYLEGTEPTAKICAGLINVAQVKDAVEYPAYRDNPVLSFATELSANAKFWPGTIPVAAEYATELRKAFDLIVHGKVSAEEGLAAVYDQVQPALDQALGK